MFWAVFFWIFVAIGSAIVIFLISDEIEKLKKIIPLTDDDITEMWIPQAPIIVLCNLLCMLRFFTVKSLSKKFREEEKSDEDAQALITGQ